MTGRDSDASVPKIVPKLSEDSFLSSGSESEFKLWD